MAGRLLIYSAIPTNRIILRCKLSAACYDVHQADTQPTLEAGLRDHAPDLIILDSGPDKNRDLDILRAINAEVGQNTPPILVLASKPDRAFRLKALATGAGCVLEQPFDDDLLLATLRGLIRQRQSLNGGVDRLALGAGEEMMEPATSFEAPGRIALVAATQDTGRAWAAAMCGLTNHELVVMSPAEVLRPDAAKLRPDVYVLAETRGQKRDGLRLMSELRSRANAETPGYILVMDPHGDNPDPSGMDVAMALDLGADAVLQRGFDAQELLLRVSTQLEFKRKRDLAQRSVRAGLRLALRDPLTSLFNRRFAMPRLQDMLDDALQCGRPLTGMILDLDRFKSINDRFGHDAGDSVLVEVSECLSRILPENALLARLGGEEFLIALPDTGEFQARRVAIEIQNALRTGLFAQGCTSEGVAVTASIGIAIAGHEPTEIDSVGHLMKAADTALYTAKNEGRDQFTLARTAA